MVQKLIRKNVKSVRICNYDTEKARIVVKETDKDFTIVNPKCYQDHDVDKHEKPFTLICWNREVFFETT